MSTSAQSRSNATEKITEVEMTDLSRASSSPSENLYPTYQPPKSTATPSIEIDGEKLKAQAEYKSKGKEKKQPGKEIKEQELKVPQEAAALDVVIAKSLLVDADSQKQAEKIKNKFNEGIDKSAFAPPNLLTGLGARGQYLERDQFRVASRNRVAEIAMFNKDYNTTTIIKNDGTEIADHGTFKHYDLFFGANGKYVLNVPQDKFAKAMSGNQPLLFGPGPHVIKDPNFKFDEATGLISQSEPVIAHGNLHVIRVPKGSIAKVWIANEPYILNYRPEPYVFNSPLFRIGKNGDSYFFNANDYVIDHGTIHILRIPAGFIAKVWDGNTPFLLHAREEPYIFDSPQFRHDKVGASPYLSTSNRVINHGTINIIRVPSGSIAKVWVGSEPRLLEARDEPYEFNTPYFEIVKNGEQYFFPSTEKLIVHGSVKRILPPINQVAITNDGGALKIIGASKDGAPTIIDSPSHYVEDFLSVATETLLFPSEETKAQRLKDDKDASKESLIYDIFTTKDSLKVGVKLMVAYQIENPELVVKTLGMKGILPHIENLATVDMGMAIQQSSSQEFMTFYQTKPHRNETQAGGYGTNQDRPPQHYQDIVKEKLAADLKEVGIKLIRLNIENPTILNKTIAGKMEEQSMMAAEANAKEAVLRQNYNIELAKAEREAAIKRVALEQENAARLSTAQSKLDAARMEADAKRLSAQADADAIVLKAEAEAKAIAAKAQAEGKGLADNPALLQLKMKELEMTALQNIKFFPPTAGTMPWNAAMNPFTLFGQMTGDVSAAGAPARVIDQSRSSAPSLSQQKKEGK